MDAQLTRNTVVLVSHRCYYIRLLLTFSLQCLPAHN